MIHTFLCATLLYTRKGVSKETNLIKKFLLLLRFTKICVLKKLICEESELMVIKECFHVD